MIGGNDIVFPAVDDAAAFEACVRIVVLRWPKARFEDAISGEKFARLADIPFARVRDLLAYPNAEAEAAWDADSPVSPENSMLYLIARPERITIVVDNPAAAEMRSILDAIHELLWADILNMFRAQREHNYQDSRDFGATSTRQRPRMDDRHVRASASARYRSCSANSTGWQPSFGPGLDMKSRSRQKPCVRRPNATRTKSAHFCRRLASVEARRCC